MAAVNANSHNTAKEHSVTESKIWQAEPHSKQKLPDGDEKADNEQNWEDVDDDEEVEDLNEFKLYKIKYYSNSDGDHMGLTIKGKANTHIESHKKIIEIMDRLPKTKEKENTFGDSKIKVIEKLPKTPSLLTIKLQVTAPDNSVGIAELKLHKPAKKGATIEIRKISDDTFDSVENLKDVIEKLLVILDSGETVSKILLAAKGKGTLSSQPLLKIISCDQCNWQTKTRPALKAHMTRLHSVMDNKTKSTQSKCDMCDFASSSVKLEDHRKKFHLVKLKTKVHSNLKRNRSVKSANDINPPLSPPKKKTILETNIEMVDMSDKSNPKDTTYSDEGRIKEIKESYEKRIAELEAIVKHMKKTSEDNKHKYEAMDTQEKIDVKQASTTVNESSNEDVVESNIASTTSKEEIIAEVKIVGQKKVEVKKIYAPFESVHKEHIPFLRGFTKRLGGIADGACTTNCATAHVFHTLDKHERQKLKRRINNQIADNWDNFYADKVPLPYKETVGTGPDRWTFEANTKDEMLTFLRSEKSLNVFANSPDILALANDLNTNIEIFSYDIRGIKERFEWQQVQPDPAMERVAMFPKGFIPTLYLYHSDDNHYDLLVRDDHKLVTEGLTVTTIKEPEKKEVWSEIKSKTQNKQSKKNALKSMNLEVFEDEQKLVNAKVLGHKRTSPQNESEPLVKPKPNQVIKCTFSVGSMQCTAALESQGLAEAHMKSHGVVKPNLYCDLCDEEFFNEQGLWRHNKNEHDTSRDSKQWNCNDCGFESTASTPLMNHCKEQGHQPSNTIQDGRGKLITCNNCQEDFTSFWNLMNHRKQKHPSNRKCRDFAKGECLRGDLCWYIHENMMELGSQNQQKGSLQDGNMITCYVCKNNFSNKNDMMNHKKGEHPSNIVCKNFFLGSCRRSEQQCWYLHKIFPGGVSSQYVSSENQKVFPQSGQMFAAPNGSPPSVEAINLNILPQSKQPYSATYVPLSGVTPLNDSLTIQNKWPQSKQAPPAPHVLPQDMSSNVKNNLSHDRQTPSVGQVQPQEMSPNIPNNLPQEQQANLSLGFQSPLRTPAPPEVSVIMLQFTQMVQRMEQMEKNFQVIFQQANHQKSLLT